MNKKKNTVDAKRPRQYEFNKKKKAKTKKTKFN